jgi:hypothetical protein
MMFITTNLIFLENQFLDKTLVNEESFWEIFRISKMLSLHQETEILDHKGDTLDLYLKNKQIFTKSITLATTMLLNRRQAFKNTKDKPRGIFKSK